MTTFKDYLKNEILEAVKGSTVSTDYILKVNGSVDMAQSKLNDLALKIKKEIASLEKRQTMLRRSQNTDKLNLIDIDINELKRVQKEIINVINGIENIKTIKWK